MKTAICSSWLSRRGSTPSVRPEAVHPGIREIVTSLRGQAEQFTLCNRLSRDDSGILLLSKSSALTDHLHAGFKMLRIAQVYLAVVTGKMSKAEVQVRPEHGSSRGRRRGRTHAKNTPPPAGTRPPEPTVIRRLHSATHRVLVQVSTRAENLHSLRAQLRSADLRLPGDPRLEPRGAPHGKVSTGPRGEAGAKPAPRRVSAESGGLHLAELAFHHPSLKRKLVLKAPAPHGLEERTEGKPDPETRLHAALVRRAACLASPDTNAYGLLLGDAERLPGLNAERFGPVVLLYVLDEQRIPVGMQRQIARWYRRMLRVEAVYVKHLPRGPETSVSRPAVLHDDPKPLAGEPTDPQLMIRENGLNFLIKPYDGVAAGLYLDQRENRARVRALAEGKDVLNLFAYTCGFSVAAAAGSARHTVSVDISTRHLEWGKENFACNNLDLTDHLFICSEALDYFKRARRQERSFDLIILDPPTFARARKSKATFQIERDLPHLLSEALTVLRPEGMLLLSTNYRKLNRRQLEQQVKACAGQRRVRIFERPPLPPDYAADPNYAKTIFARFL